MELRTLREFQKMTTDDQREFNKWVNANAVVGSLLAVGLLAMALAGARSAAPDGAGIAVSPDAAKVATSNVGTSRQATPVRFDSKIAPSGM
jgi:hypothetical protein